MKFFKEQKNYAPNKTYLRSFLKEFWYIPSDILQRSMEASIWHLCTFKSPTLSIGIGNGRIDNLIFKNHKVFDVGIDIEEEGLAEAKESGKYKKVLKVDAAMMPFKSASFSTVISNSTFEHINSDKKAVREVGRVLKKGGLFMITAPCNYLEEWILAEEEKLGVGAKKRVNQFNKRANHLHYHTISEWEKMLAAGGMDLVLYKYYFPREVATYWYRLFKFFTGKVGKREKWSWLGDSRLTGLVPKGIARLLMKSMVENKFKNGFFINEGTGAQLFIIAQKK